MSLGPAPAARPRHAPPQGPSTGRPRAPAPPRGPGIPRPGRSSTLVRTPRACGRPLPPLLPDYKRGIHYCGSHFGFMVSSPPILFCSTDPLVSSVSRPCFNRSRFQVDVCACQDYSFPSSNFEKHWNRLIKFYEKLHYDFWLGWH